MYTSTNSPYLKVIVIIIIIVIVTFFYYFKIINSSVNDEEVQKIFIIEPGTNVSLIADSLIEKELLNSSLFFQLYIKLKKLDDKIQAGDHYLSSSMSVKEIAVQLTTPTYQDEVSVTFIEGWTNEEMTNYLDVNNIILAAKFISALDQKYSYDFLPKRNINDYLQGYLFPDTYRIFADSEPEDLIIKQLNNFEHKVIDSFKEQIDKSDLSLAQIVTLASIIEHEVRLPADKALVADIFLRRLADNYPLQSDATVNYVTNRGVTQPTFAETKIDSPYNTYKYAGLPPGPICNPSLSSINAVLNPMSNTYYFFLTTNDDGRVIYGHDYDEHLVNKAKYLD